MDSALRKRIPDAPEAKDKHLKQEKAEKVSLRERMKQ